MGRRNHHYHLHTTTKSHTLPSSPTHSSSSSDFEFTISISPRKSSATTATADELFHKGKLLPLHLSLRRSLLSSDSTSSSSFTTSRASTSSDSSRPSSATDNDTILLSLDYQPTTIKSPKYFSLSKLSSVFRKNTTSSSSNASKRAKQVIFKYLKKVKPLYEKLSNTRISRSTNTINPCMIMKDDDQKVNLNPNISHSFSGNLNLRNPNRRRSYISSCPSSMMSSPTHGKSGLGFAKTGRVGSSMYSSDASSMEELQSAIQGAIMHCKNSMLQNKIIVSNEI